MLGFFVAVLALLLVGEIVAATFVPIVPGPLIGMVLLLGVFIVRGGVPASFEAPASGLVGHLTLFILPASLGILSEWRRLDDVWLAMACVVVASSLVTALVTTLVAGGLLRAHTNLRDGEPPAPAEHP